MNCSIFRRRLTNQGAELSSDPALAKHIDECELCHNWYEGWQLKQAIKYLPVPEPRTEFADEAIHQAVAQASNQRRPFQRWGIVAAVMIAITLGVVFQSARVVQESVDQSANMQTVDASSEQTVKVVINAVKERPGASLTIDLAENLELKGFPDRKQIAWQADIKKGRNLLSLPVLIKQGQRSTIHLSYRYNGSEKALEIPVKPENNSANQTETT